jgi:hypothetical protein
MTPSTLIKPTFHEFFLHLTKAYYTNINSHTVTIIPKWPHRRHSTTGPIIFLHVSTLHTLTSLHVSLHIHIVLSHTTTTTASSLTTTNNHLQHHCRPTSSCTHIVLHIRIYSQLQKDADHIEMFILAGPMKRSPSKLHPPSPHNKQTNSSNYHQTCQYSENTHQNDSNDDINLLG